MYLHPFVQAGQKTASSYVYMMFFLDMCTIVEWGYVFNY